MVGDAEASSPSKRPRRGNSDDENDEMDDSKLMNDPQTYYYGDYRGDDEFGDVDDSVGDNVQLSMLLTLMVKVIVMYCPCLLHIMGHLGG